ncbi:type II secretion system protein GspM [Algibacillus agarilyticus]|uniref:type II secretion system protein GspM n=1 Tax=Algibacillus agarilyticus TaxID=2234133 RepID=UPI001E2F01FE|nr:type II secretion system protein M [Algibacillus agarilyticus]
MNIKQWYNSLAKREQNLINGASVVLLIGLVFQLIIGPINARAAKAELDVVNKAKLLAWVAENGSKYKAANRKVGGSGSSLSNIVNRSARQAGITISGTKPQGTELQIQLDNVEFNRLLKWLETLVEREQVRITMFDINADDKPGEVRVKRLQLAK